MSSGDAPDAASPLAALLADLARQRAGHAYPELPALDEFRDIWSRLSAVRQLRQSEAQVPENAGPLNSNSLVYLALSFMQERSPDYLRHFLSYADALSWMEQLHGAIGPAKDAPRAAPARKSPRAKPR